jgi:hypothetical protein
VFVEVDLALPGDYPPADTLYNTSPLVVENPSLSCLPPHFVYIHSHTSPVEMRFKHNDPTANRWHAGDLFGWLVLAGHGMDFDTLAAAPSFASTPGGNRVLTDQRAEFEQVVGALPELASTTTLNVDNHDVVVSADVGAFTQPGYRDSLLAGLDSAAVRIDAGRACEALPILVNLQRHVNGKGDPPVWISDATVRSTFLTTIGALIGVASDSASHEGPCFVTGVAPASLPDRVAIVGIRPNPSFGSTNIGYALPRAGRVTLSIYDLAGRKIRTVVDGERPAGVHWAVWDGTRSGGGRVASGAYFARLTVGGFTETKRLVMLH